MRSHQLEERLLFTRTLVNLVFGGCDRASRAINSCSRSSDREQEEEEVNGMVTMEASRDTGGELVLQ